MIDPENRLSVTQQCQVLNLPRSTVYYRPRPASAETLNLMHRIDEIHLERPFHGSRGLKKDLKREGYRVGRERVRRLMKVMGIESVYRKPKTSRRHPKHPVYPYLLRKLRIERPNHVWASDITYIPMARGFVFLCVVMDWASRKVLAWRLSNTLTTDFCLDALNEAICRYGKPEIFNTDQGCQFTSSAFTGHLRDNGIAISMDGKGCWRDNVFVERLWKSVKYEDIYLYAYETVTAVKQGLGRYFTYYNQKRAHTALDDKTPNEFYEGELPVSHCAA